MRLKVKPLRKPLLRRPAGDVKAGRRARAITPGSANLAKLAERHRATRGQRDLSGLEPE